MTFIELVNRARRECQVTGDALPSLANADLTTEGLRFKDWVNDAWLDLQTYRFDWEWARVATTFQTVVGQASYTRAQAGAASAANWKPDSFRAYLTATGVSDEAFLAAVPYNWYRDTYAMGAASTQQGRPVFIAIQPDRGIAIGPVPDAVYTVRAEYWREAQSLVDDSDDPSDFGLPEPYHMLIVYGAMRSYASFEAASEVLQRADTEIRKLVNRLFIQGLPDVGFGGPLA